MIAVLQRVSEARVTVAGDTVGEIGAGLLVLVCAEQGDTELECDKMLNKLLKLRIFNDDAGKMNHSVQNLDGRGTVGDLLLVSQFTLAADVQRGQPPRLHGGCQAGRGAPLVQLLGGAGPVGASGGANRPISDRDAGASGQRWPGHHSAAHCASGWFAIE